ncbi:MAG: uroporphyrinogen-III C-methyltransferase [Flavobacteriaceae bacterium]|nr:MAG: uroporphyrinogen-III C-methyltransferase [Flavobacteriaceae bacterium]
MKAKLTLIGAGPGDPELITLKAVKALEKADVVLYDSLVNPELLSLAKKAELIWVGKRKDRHSIGQDVINGKILELSKTHTNLVRLKGGDCMVFGRAYQEIETALLNGLHVEVIPGISTYSAFAAQSLTPITKREISSGFWVISATNLREELMADLRFTAESTSTILIYMGFEKLSEIVSIFKEIKPDHFPIGIFQNISLESYNYALGTLGDIQEKALAKNISTPAMIVAGYSLEHSPILNPSYLSTLL